ncbi:MAG TPA: TauD/TfdA family dioxygenase [Chitinophaga sp.]|uniref:TauD/TfdA dioxygenase family protein n=1 Tax=Chitinophaga sp. TaxID=1869181 RepID=UPI002B6BC66C|nr:TauD/TfdA family dioxygenase [Chitinophaga sp.]HVI45040.1 TauD/TfdA family dioxygenase [Chitinophaga sp.]
METKKAIFNDAPAGEIGAEIIGLDLRTLPADAPELEEILQLIYRNKLIVIRGQSLTPEEYVAFTKKLGRPQIYFQTNYHHPEHPEIFVSSNVLEDNKKIGVSGTGRYWHTDCAFEEKPLSFTSLLPQIFPKSVRETYYIDMSKVYRNLPADLKAYVDNTKSVQDARLRYKVQESDIDKSILEILERFGQEAPPVEHPTVIEHPVTHEKILYINSGFTTKLVGLTHEENETVLRALFDFVEKEENIHTHSWEEGDLLIWDNRFLIHKASSVPKGEMSKSYRIGIYDNHPFYVGLEK